MSMRKSYAGVAIIAPTTLPYARSAEQGAAWFFGRTLKKMLDAVSIDKAEIDGLSIASFSLAPDTVVSLADHFCLDLDYIEQLPLGGASGVIAAKRAARAIQAGDAEMVACIGADTNQSDSFKDLVSNFSVASKKSVYPYGAGGPNSVFALIADNYMRQNGIDRRDTARISVSQRENASHFPHALFRELITVDDYLDARPIASPFHLLDCVMPCAGGEGFIVTTIERAKFLKLPFATLLSAAEKHNAFRSDPVAIRGGWSTFADDLYNQAGVGPADIDALETYDDYPIVSMLQIEELGFCSTGESGNFVRDIPLTTDGGGLPHNTSGGQLSCGQAGAAGGFLGFVEGARQVTGQALGLQVPDAKHVMVSGYGMVNYDRGVCSSAAILGAGKL